MPWVGSLVDRFGPRIITSAGTVRHAISRSLTGLPPNLWHLALVYCVLASLGLSCVGPVVANAVVSRWFIRRRGFAISILGSAAMTGMSLLVPVVAWLIITVGWRMAYGVIGLVVLLVILPLCLFVVRESPEAFGLAPDGYVARPDAAATPATRTPVATAMRTLAFWQLAGSFFPCGFSMRLLSPHGG